jgi:ABC-2 type transport system permease protein
MSSLPLPEEQSERLEMSQIAATAERTLKENMREKAALFWIIAWPIIWVVIDSFVFATQAPEEYVAPMKGSFTIAMMVFAAAMAGMITFPSSIASDRERGVFLKLFSMPIKPWRDSLGRLLGVFAFAVLAVVLTLAAGFICGAEFQPLHLGALKSLGFFLLIFLASVGIGMIVGTFIKSINGATMTGVAIAVITAMMSGIFVPYSTLPSPLQAFARIYPISSCNSSVIFLLTGGGEMAGYDPLTTGQIALTVALSLAIFALGLVLYRRFCWGRR